MPITRGCSVSAAFALLALYLALSIAGRPALSIGRWRFAWPPWRLALAQIVTGCANYIMVAAALEHTIAPAGELDYFTVAAAYILANLAALARPRAGRAGRDRSRARPACCPARK